MPRTEGAVEESRDRLGFFPVALPIVPRRTDFVRRCAWVGVGVGGRPPTGMQMSPEGMTWVFAYGTLMWPNILKLMLGREPHFRAAMLRGRYKRMAVANQRFPAVVGQTAPGAGEQSALRGLVVLVDEVYEVPIFDMFEGELYTRETTEVQVIGDVANPFAWAVDGTDGQGEPKATELVKASFYLWAQKLPLRANVEWQPKEHLAPYLDAYVASVVRGFASHPSVVKLRTERDARLKAAKQHARKC